MNTKQPSARRGLRTPASIVLLLLALLAGVGIGALADKDETRTTTTIVEKSTKPVPSSSPEPPSEPCPGKTGAQLHSRQILEGVSGSVSMKQGRRLITLSVTGKVPRRATVLLYNSRTHNSPILSLIHGDFRGSFPMSYRRLARFDAVVLAAVVHRPRRRGVPAHRAVRVLARASIPRLLNSLQRCPTPAK